MKLELAVPSPTHGGDGMRKCRKLVARSSVGSSERGRSGFIGGGGGGVRQLCGSPVMLPRGRGTFDDVASVEVEENPNVKLELGVSSPFPRTSHI